MSATTPTFFAISTRPNAKIHFTTPELDGCKLVTCDTTRHPQDGPVEDTELICRNCLKLLYLPQDPQLSSIEKYYVGESVEGKLHLRRNCGNMHAGTASVLSKKEAIAAKKTVCTNCRQLEAVKQLILTKKANCDQSIEEDEGISHAVPHNGEETENTDEGIGERSSATEDDTDGSIHPSVSEVEETTATGIGRSTIFFGVQSATNTLLHLNGSCVGGQQMSPLAPTADGNYSICEDCSNTNPTVFYKGKSSAVHILHLTSTCGNGKNLASFVPTRNFEKYTLCKKCSKKTL